MTKDKVLQALWEARTALSGEQHSPVIWHAINLVIDIRINSPVTYAADYKQLPSTCQAYANTSKIRPRVLALPKPSLTS